MQHKKRGRPRLREEENFRDVAPTSEYSHTSTFPGSIAAGTLSQAARRGSKSYRELRSQPGSSYGDQRPQTSEMNYPNNHFAPGVSPQPFSPPASYLSHSLPTALLTPDLIMAQYNRAFDDALNLPFAVQGRSLLDLVVPSEREKTQRLQAALRAELLDASHLPPLRGSPSSLRALPPVEEVDLAHVTAGFRTRSEYCTFRLPQDQSRGFPISISLARTSFHFIVLTLVHNVNHVGRLPSPPTNQIRRQSIQSPQLMQGTNSPSYEHASMQHRRVSGGLQASPLFPPSLVSNRSSASVTSNMTSGKSSTSDGRTPPLQTPHGLVQYSQRSPPRSLPYDVSRTPSNSSNGSGASGPLAPTSAPRGSDAQDRRISQGDLRHLQLPPIRTSPNGDDAKANGKRKNPSSGKSSPARMSPQSARRKKGRRVDIGDILH